MLRVDGAGDAKNIYDFSSHKGPAGLTARLLRDSSGDIFGIASRIDEDNAGTAVFKISHGHETTLHFFGEGTGAYGAPKAGLAMDAGGNLYGATTSGGANDLGMVFKVAADGTTTVLHEFGGPDGKWPPGDLMIDTQGSVVGTTFGGGAEDSGTIFRIAPDGSAFEQLHSFADATEGKYLWGGLVEDEHGNFTAPPIMPAQIVLAPRSSSPPKGSSACYTPSAVVLMAGGLKERLCAIPRAISAA